MSIFLEFVILNVLEEWISSQPILVSPIEALGKLHQLEGPWLTRINLDLEKAIMYTNLLEIEMFVSDSSVGISNFSNFVSLTVQSRPVF